MRPAIRKRASRVPGEQGLQDKAHREKRTDAERRAAPQRTNHECSERRSSGQRERYQPRREVGHGPTGPGPVLGLLESLDALRGRIVTLDPSVDDEEAGNGDAKSEHAEREFAKVAAYEAGIEQQRRTEHGQRVKLQRDQQHDHGADQEHRPVRPLPPEQEQEEHRDARDEEHVHARRLRIDDEFRQQRHAGDERQVPGRHEKAPTREISEHDQEDAAQRRRQAQSPLRFAECGDGCRHEIELPDRPRVEHPARQNRRAMLHDVLRGHRHRFLVAVQPDGAETPEAQHGTGHDDDEEQEPLRTPDPLLGARRHEQRRKLGEDGSNHGAGCSRVCAAVGISNVCSCNAQGSHPSRPPAAGARESTRQTDTCPTSPAGSGRDS